MPRRARTWARTTGTISTTDNAQGQASLDTQFATEYGTTRLPIGTTIGGLLVDFQAVQTEARAAATDALWMGIYVVDEPTTPSDDPYNDVHADWMWRQQIPTQSATGSVASPFLARGEPVRIKSMRKIDDLGKRPWFVVYQFGTTSFDIHYSISLMLLLP